MFCAFISEFVDLYTLSLSELFALTFFRHLVYFLLAALDDGVGDLRPDLRCSSTRLRAHWNHKQLPHPDQVKRKRKTLPAMR